MTSEPVPTSTSQCIPRIAKELDLDAVVVEKVLDAFIKRIKAAMRDELPFMVRGLGKFYFRYINRLKYVDRGGSYADDKVHREIVFSALDELKAEFHGWVHSFGLKDNQTRTVLSMKIQPDELGKLMKKKTLDDQRSLGFRSELLFNELPDAEKSLAKDLENSPTISQIAERIGRLLRDE